MKKALIVAALMSLIASDANAVVYCAAGVYRAGCVVRPGYGYHPYAKVGVHPYARHYGYRPYVRRY
jgi:hypothetical protein